MDDKKSAPARARSSEVQAHGDALQTQYNFAAPPAPRPPAQSSYDNIPAELRAFPQWVCWRYEQVNGRQTKVPYNPVTGRKASSTDPASWGKFDAARNAIATMRMTGIGFVLADSDPFTGIDIDDKKDNPASDHERAVHAAILANVVSYTERSPGERWRDEQGNERGGYHIIVRGRIAQGRDRDHVGVYSSKRYLTFTGDVTCNAPIANYQTVLDGMASQMTASADVELEDVESSHTDADIHTIACNATNGDKYQALCACTSCVGEGDRKVDGTYLAMGYPTQSEADFALLSIIAFYTPDNAQVRNIFRCTGLGRREKATKNDSYLNKSLKKIRAGQADRADTAMMQADAANWIARATAPVDTDTDDDLPPIQGPEVTPAMYYGLVGQVMHAASNGTEVNPVAAGLSFITMASAAIGRNKFFQIGDEQHHARINAIHVGRSSQAGKGMATALTKRIRKEAERVGDSQANGPYVCGNYHSGGMSSGEGVIYAIRDASEPNEKEEISDRGVPDKRLYVFEPELANILRQAKRDGNTLSATIRMAFDGDDLAPATKNNRMRATAPHICFYGGITPFELRESLDQNNLTNGFANRFLFCVGERIGIVPVPQPTPDHVVIALATKLLAAIRQAETSGRVNATEEAVQRYKEFYSENRRGRGRSERVRGLLQRHPPYAWRLSLLFALLDCKSEIDACHMKAAIAWLQYCKDSTVAIFSTARDEAQVSQSAEWGDKIVTVLQKAAGRTMDRESIRVEVGKPKPKDLNAALQHLKDTLMVKEIVTPIRGKPRREYQLIGIAPPPPVSTEGTP